MANLDAYAVFAAVVEAESFTGAARALGRTKSGVSKAVGRLEDRLGVRLLNRTTRRIGLTEAGAAFHARCLHILAEAEDAEREAAHLSAAPRGVLRVSAPVTFGTLHLAPLLPRFLAAYPEVSIDMTLSDRYVDLVEEGVDLAVRIGRLDDSALVARRLAPFRLIVCAAPGYWNRHGRPARPAELAGHNCLGYSYLSTGDSWRFEGKGGGDIVRISGSLRSNNDELLRAAAVAGIGVALSPGFVVARDIAEGRLEAVLAGYCAPEGGIYAVHPPGRYLPAKVRSFIDFLAARFDEAPFGENGPA